MKNFTFRRLIGAGIACAAISVSAVAVAAPAGADTGRTPDATSTVQGRHARLHLTDQQKQCLKDHGITRPLRPLTKEKVAALKAAAKACDIKLPNRGHRGNHPRLTADQRTCMQDHGITRPLRPLTPEKIAALKAAAQACGIQLPNRGAQAQA